MTKTYFYQDDKSNITFPCWDTIDNYKTKQKLFSHIVATIGFAFLPLMPSVRIKLNNNDLLI